MKRNLFCLLFLLLTLNTYAQDRQAAFEVNERLGRGINMGNAFEAPTESGWGNPWQPEYFQLMAKLGFQHVRLPVQWESPDRSLETAPYTINPSFLARIREVVDHALANNLMIIINMHHHELLYDDPLGQKERFLAQWAQIADYFKDYPEELIFEVMNEPHGNLSPSRWNEFFADALELIRETNPERMVLMGTAEYGGLSGLQHLELPDDENLIVSVHYYNPFSFTHQGAEWTGAEADAWLGTEWEDTEAEREAIISEFAAALAFSKEENVPIHVGEFGAYSKADLESRVLWTTFLARWFEVQDMSWAYWEFSAGFGIYDPASGEFLQPLVDALLHNEMLDPVEVEATEIYKSDFSNGPDGWTLQVQNEAQASLNASEGKLQVTIEHGGSESWHVQLLKSGLPLEENKKYRIRVKAAAGAERNTTMYIGKASDPWNAYNGYPSIALSPREDSFINTFQMTSPGDTEARLVFDLGNSPIDLEVFSVVLEEIRTVGRDDQQEPEEPEVTALPKEELPGFRYYPNPVTSKLRLSHGMLFRQAYLYDLQGRRLEVFELHEAEAFLNLEKYQPGQYIIRLEGNPEADPRFLILKQ